ncbi:hypothetical protein [Rhizobium sp. BG4]|uniref:hypothetical protein n=1 Tax=Rhizobium sp. BG4 TaxID=2613770 RepID=UPI00193DFC66|nr:hypothetical protein [Rhizobium sp. BG4]QRM42816.1 hypothetical protein F2982_04890 [Rhizobium sp. BG4]
MNVSQWLLTRAHGYGDLEASEVRAIEEFSVVWTYFENVVCGKDANVASIRAAVEKLRESKNGIDVKAFQTALKHFSERYFPNGHQDGRFDGLKWRKGGEVAAKEKASEVLTGKATSPSDQLEALLFITYRLRNNLFHGEKWAYGLKDQMANFSSATHTLINMVDQFEAAGLR